MTPDPIAPLRERGSGTVMAAAAALLMCFLAAALAAGMQASTAVARASKAADLAALAAADAARGLLDGDPCGLAGDVAREHGAELAKCRRHGAAGAVVDIDVAVPLPQLFGMVHAPWKEAEGRARAGPPP